jgi:NAD(P)-dependent dehydrogenase (short-subunit alcohol dehydrogenase family)
MPAKIDLEGRVILVTGASRGIGEAVARAAVEHRASVVLASRRQEALDEVAAGLRELGGKVFALATHMGKPEEIERLFAKATEELGHIDGLVNNAATNPYFGPMIDISESAFDKTFEVNVKGYFNASVQFVRHLRERKAQSGSIVNIASVAGMRSAPMQGVYGMSKAAVISMTQSMAYELGGSNIRVNAVCPGLIETKFASAIVKNESLRKHVVSRTPLGRHGQPDEIAGACTYLISDAASYVTGQTMVIDGGMIAN